MYVLGVACYVGSLEQEILMPEEQFTPAGMEKMFMPWPYGLYLTHLSLTARLPSLALDTSEITNATGQETHPRDAVCGMDFPR